jgi:hypothetical protein
VQRFRRHAVEADRRIWAGRAIGARWGEGSSGLAVLDTAGAGQQWRRSSTIGFWRALGRIRIVSGRARRGVGVEVGIL